MFHLRARWFLSHYCSRILLSGSSRYQTLGIQLFLVHRSAGLKNHQREINFCITSPRVGYIPSLLTQKSGHELDCHDLSVHVPRAGDKVPPLGTSSVGTHDLFSKQAQPLPQQKDCFWVGSQGMSSSATV